MNIKLKYMTRLPLTFNHSPILGTCVASVSSFIHQMSMGNGYVPGINISKHKCSYM